MSCKEQLILQIGDIDVKVSRRKIKNVNLYIKPDGSVLVTAPYYVKEDYIKKFLNEKHLWIVEHRKKIMQEAEKRKLADNELKKQRENSADNSIYTKEQLTELIRLVKIYADKWEPIMGVKCRQWTIREMKTLWGSCSVNKHTIRLNKRLALKPPECVELIVVHELTHMLEPSHNKVFKAYMTQFLPDWKEREKML